VGWDGGLARSQPLLSGSALPYAIFKMATSPVLSFFCSIIGALLTFSSRGGNQCPGCRSSKELYAFANGSMAERWLAIFETGAELT